MSKEKLLWWTYIVFRVLYYVSIEEIHIQGHEKSDTIKI